MDDPTAKLIAWTSPGYPVGAFAWSHGLEWTVAAGDVFDRATLEAWVGDVLRHGAGWTDAVLLAGAWRAERDGDAAALAEMAALAAALAPSAERSLETMALGAAFADVTAAAWAAGPCPAAYPVAFGQASALHGIPLGAALRAYLQAVVANLVSAGIRLGVVGQTDGQRVLAALLPSCARLAAEAVDSGPDDAGGCALRGDIASMCHETQETRLFRS
jgi:urease accessory protein